MSLCHGRSQQAPTCRRKLQCFASTPTGIGLGLGRMLCAKELIAFHFFLDCHPDLSTREEAASSCCHALAGVRCSFSQKPVAAAAACISCDVPQAFPGTMVGTVTPLTCGFLSSGPPSRPLACSLAPDWCCPQTLGVTSCRLQKKVSCARG